MMCMANCINIDYSYVLLLFSKEAVRYGLVSDAFAKYAFSHPIRALTKRRHCNTFGTCATGCILVTYWQ